MNMVEKLLKTFPGAPDPAYILTNHGCWAVINARESLRVWREFNPAMRPFAVYRPKSRPEG